jgi:hypothetical protein
LSEIKSEVSRGIERVRRAKREMERAAMKRSTRKGCQMIVGSYFSLRYD